MDSPEQVMNVMNNIAIRVGELEVKTTTAMIVAGISALGAVVAASITVWAKGKINRLQREHDKQWAFLNKTSLLIDNAIELFSRLLHNKILLAYNTDVSQAGINIFLLQKDLLTVEGQLVAYGSMELAQCVSELKNTIVNTPNSDFIKSWNVIYQKGHEYLKLCSKHLGNKVDEDYKRFVSSLKLEAPSKPESIQLRDVKGMGALTE